MDALNVINYVISVIFILCYSYQFLYILVPVLKKAKPHKEEQVHNYAVLISARNEQAVIGNLLDSIARQTYERGSVTVFVVADNCTDETARVASEHGAVVFERFDTSRVGKGYALAWLMERIDERYPDKPFDGYFVFDADNVLEESYIAEMNRTFSDGYEVVTSYRNSKNYGDNWISAGYALWFLRESQFLNRCRALLGTSAAVSGTGFLFSRRAIDECGGWHFFLLTEDIEFTIECVTRGWKIGYCEKAVLYDEQPTTFRQSWDQRLRWSKGFYQVDRAYTLPLLKGCLRWGHKGTSCYDMFATVAPGMLLTLFIILFNGVVLAACLTQPTHMAARIIHECLGFIGSNLWNFYLGLLAYGMLTVLSEWRHISAAPMQKIGYVFTFPVFMFTYIPISIAALVRKVEWKPIYHTAAKKLNELG